MTKGVDKEKFEPELTKLCEKHGISTYVFISLLEKDDKHFVQRWYEGLSAMEFLGLLVFVLFKST